MSVRSGQSVTKVFTLRRFDTGAAANADSTPTGTLYVNGVANGASVTVTNITTGVYRAAVTLPSLSIGDVLDLRIAATVNAIADNGVIWSDTKDVDVNSSGIVPADFVWISGNPLDTRTGNNFNIWFGNDDTFITSERVSNVGSQVYDYALNTTPLPVDVVAVNGTTFVGGAVPSNVTEVGGFVVSAEAGQNWATFWDNGGDIDSYLLTTGLPAFVVTGGITAASFAADSISASAVAAGVGTEIGTAVWASATRTLSSGGVTEISEAVESAVSTDPEEVADLVASAVVAALTSAGVLDDAGLTGESTVEMFRGEDRDLATVLSDAEDMTGSTFAFAIAETLAEALAGTGIATVPDADIDVSGHTVTVDAEEIGTADLDPNQSGQSYFYALRRTDTGNRSVKRWGKWVVV